MLYGLTGTTNSYSSKRFMVTVGRGHRLIPGTIGVVVYTTKQRRKGKIQGGSNNEPATFRVSQIYLMERIDFPWVSNRDEVGWVASPMWWACSVFGRRGSLSKYYLRVSKAIHLFGCWTSVSDTKVKEILILLITKSNNWRRLVFVGPWGTNILFVGRAFNMQSS